MKFPIIIRDSFLMLNFICGNFEWCLQLVIYKHVILSVLRVTTLPLFKKMSVPLTQKLFYRSIIELKYSSAFSIPYLYYILRAFLSSIKFSACKITLKRIRPTAHIRMTQQSQRFVVFQNCDSCCLPRQEQQRV